MAKSSPNDVTTDFIKAECEATLYPALCIQCLSSYSTTIQNSHKQLAQAALSVSLSRAQSTASFIAKLARIRGFKPIQHRAVRDCLANMANSVDQLSRSVKELAGMRDDDFDWHENNVDSWVGAALTFENTCLDLFAGPTMDGNVKVAVRRMVMDCAQVTSNALALVHRYAARHSTDVASSESNHNLP
ncbi:hypothetical protein DH2020_027608 [Rehmannia glutinosa]|uniref:Pectinesterase inhibitor domain-containing protein n=1 Tax=Rehmannia glutinosa TaxID=99300 RepID=A0ABR0VTR2_REHGL